MSPMGGAGAASAGDEPGETSGAPAPRGADDRRQGASRPLRVTFVVPDLGIGGAERHVVDLLGRLDRDLVDPRVVCLGEPGVLYAEASRVAPATAYGHHKRDAARSVLRLARDLRRSRADVVVLRGYSAETVGRVAAALARVPRSVVWVHNCGDTEPRGRVRAGVDRLLDRVTDAYFGVAHAQVDYLVGELGHPRDKVAILHNGVDVERYGTPAVREGRDALRDGLGLAPEHVVVGIVAALRPEKDHETFLDAAALVAAVAPHVRFVIAGDGQRRAAVEARAAERGLADRVVFAGFRDDVPAVLAALEVCVLSSRTVECFPISLLEAMATGLPVVATDVGGVAEIVDDGVTGDLIAAGDPAALARRLAALVADPALRAAYGDAGRARVAARFTLERNVRETERRLVEVAGRRPASGGGSRRPVRLAAVMDTTAVGGAEVVTLHTFAAIDRARVEPRLVCLREPGPLADDYRAVGVDVDALGRSGRFDLRTLPRLVGLLRRAGTDAVLVQHHHRAALVLGRLAAALAGVRVVLVAPHDMDLVPLGGRVLPTWTVATLRWTSALVLLAEAQGRYLHRHEGVGRRPWSSTREVVVPNGIPLPAPPTAADRAAARERLGVPGSAYVVGVVARLSAQKAHEVLITAFAEVVARVPDALLVVVGGGDREAELRALVAELGLESTVRFAGVRRDASALVAGFDVLALSSVHEAAPVTVIEAMAAGVPPVVTDCGALRDMVEDGIEGEVVAVGDVAGMATALVGLAERPERRLAMGRAARSRAERDFDVAATARGYERLLGELVAG